MDDYEILEKPACAKPLKEIAAEYVKTSDEIADLKSKLDKATKAKLDLVTLLTEAFARDGVEAIEIDDDKGTNRRLAPSSKIWASLQLGSKPDQRVSDILKRHDLGDLIQPTVNSTQLSADIRARVKAAKGSLNVTEAEILESLGDELAGEVKITVKQEISLTRKAKK